MVPVAIVTAQGPIVYPANYWFLAHSSWTLGGLSDAVFHLYLDPPRFRSPQPRKIRAKSRVYSSRGVVCLACHMSRDGRDDDREADLDRADDRDPARAAQREADIQERIADVPARDLDLPKGDEREVVEFRGHDYRLDGNDVRVLATTGAFRVVSAHDLTDAPEGTSRHLIDQGLMTRETIVDQTGAHHVFALTRDGKGLLEAHQHPAADGRQQAFYAEVVKPRELRHDAQLASAYRAEAARIEREGGRVTRVVLDYELKREYQQYLHRDGADMTTWRKRCAWIASSLPMNTICRSSMGTLSCPTSVSSTKPRMAASRTATSRC